MGKLEISHMCFCTGTRRQGQPGGWGEHGTPSLYSLTLLLTKEEGSSVQCGVCDQCAQKLPRISTVQKALGRGTRPTETYLEAPQPNWRVRGCGHGDMPWLRMLSQLRGPCVSLGGDIPETALWWALNGDHPDLASACFSRYPSWALNLCTCVPKCVSLLHKRCVLKVPLPKAYRTF